ncbi:MAG: DEAD/DEAH box helicase [Verrucomicrobiota bacterium]
MPFRHFGLEDEIVRAIQKAGYTRPTPVQTAAIPKAIEGHDLMAIAQTGTGKTAAFVLPILQRISVRHREGKELGTKALILAPTRELAIQITDNVRAYGKHLPIRVAAIYGGVDEAIQLRALRKGPQIIVATPGKLMNLLERQKVDFSDLEMLVLDEADRMLDMGFLPDIETIIRQIPKRRQTLMFSATLSKEIESLARKFQCKPQLVQIGQRTNPAETVAQYVYEVPAHLKGALLLELFKQPECKMVLVFVRMKDGADRLMEFLKAAKINVAKLHSSRSQEERSGALQDFKDGKVRVLVATDIVARGIDIEGVSHVVNFDFPVKPEDYIHRIGRTGRAKARGTAISLVPPHDLNLLDHLELTIKQRLQRIRLKGFDYNAPVPPRNPNEKPAKHDWRKRTREWDGKNFTKPAAKKSHPKRGGK